MTTPGKLLAALIALVPAFAGQDLKLSYVSAIDQTEQPYRLFVPTAYTGDKELPLIVFMHGTGGDEGTVFDDERYDEGAIEEAAEKHGVLVVSPDGRGITEYRGIGENDVFNVLAEVQKNYRVDPDRIYLTGHSMGGTGGAYLALHHPDQFAAVAPLAAAYSFPWLARNATHVPFLWIGGADDLEFYLRGVGAGVERMRKFGVPVKLEIQPGEGHFGAVKDFERVFAWLLQHKRNAHPTEYVFEVDTPMHGRAYWTAVEKIARPGEMARIRGRADGQRALIETENVAEFELAPDPQVFDLTAPVEVIVDGEAAYSGPLAPTEALRAVRRGGGWSIERGPKTPPPPVTGYRQFPVATAPEQLDMTGTEKRLANWITDAMREAADADIALYNGYAYRGLPIPEGTVDVVDLIQCSRPFDQYLVAVELTGADLLEILDDNLPNPERDRHSSIDELGASPIVQLSGASYVFDMAKPKGQRIVSSSLDPERTYRVVLEGQAVERETVRLAGRFKNLDYETLDVAFTLALYGYAARRGTIEAQREGRVVEAQADESR